MATLTLRPNGNSSISLVGFGAGTDNYGHVNEVTLDETNGVYSPSGYYYDDYTMQDHGTEVGTINNVKVYARANHVAGVSGEYIKLRCNTNQAGEQGTSVTDTLYYSTWNINPSSGVAWTWSDIDSLTAGIYMHPVYYTNKSPWWSVIYCYQLYVVVDYTPAGGGLFFANG